MNKREVGTHYETIAIQELIINGYEIIERNFRCRYGEIDIIAKRNGVIAFIEVKYRNSSEFGSPEEAVDNKKQQTIYRVAEIYLIRNKLSEQISCRFDTVVILGDSIRIIENAFGGI